MHVVEGTEQIPERWIGQTVLISMISTEMSRDGSPLPLSSTIKKGELKAVTDRGNVAALTSTTDLSPDPATCLYEEESTSTMEGT